MIRFNCDYTEGAHPQVLQKFISTNMEQTAGYGVDDYCAHAAQLIRHECKADNALVKFLVGGTQTNLTVISAALRPHQGVISADVGHINVHESGAIEGTGHKVSALPCENAKLTAAQVDAYVRAHYDDETFEHIVQPKMVYISHPTELGTLYTKQELTELSAVCRKHDLYFYVDGARMAYGLTAPQTDVTLADFAALTDAFYIGGTKVGLLFGEALVIMNELLKKDIGYIIKQKGGLLAKGRLLGLQFEALFEDGLYYKMGAHANEAASIIRDACKQAGFDFLCPSPSNQQFPILPDDLLKKLEQDYAYANFGRIDNSHCAVRFCTSWATDKEDAKKLAADILAYKS